MLFFIRSLFAQTLLNAFFVLRIWRSREISTPLKWLFSAIYGVETLIYFIGLLAGERLPIDCYSLIQKISGIWVIAHLYLGVLVLVFDLFNYLNKRCYLLLRFNEKVIRRTQVVCFLSFSLFICTQLYVGYENFLHPEIKTISFSFNKSNSTQAIPLQKYKLLVAADMHLGYIINKEVLQEYVQIINSQKADIVVIDGDLIDYTLRPLVIGKMDEELRKIQAPKGVFFIPGNHEYKFNPELKLDWIRKAGMIILKDSVAVVDHVLWLIGRDDRSNEDNRVPIEKLMTQADTTQACIFLSHQPGDIQDAYRYHIPLTICGHTHGGQVFPMNLLGKILYSNAYGLQQKGTCHSYTTSGLGLSGFPLRISTRSEIVVFNIEIY